MRRKTQTVYLSEPWDYENLTEEVVLMFGLWEDLHPLARGDLIIYASALEACDDDDVLAGNYPISGTILLDLIEKYDVTQQHLALAMGVNRNVIFRRVNAERKLRQQGVAS